VGYYIYIAYTGAVVVVIVW